MPRGGRASATAMGIGVALAVPVGAAYGWLLNRTRGQEMMVGTYLGFALVSGMCIFWLLAPFHNPELVWAIGGKGLRTTLTLGGVYDKHPRPTGSRSTWRASRSRPARLLSFLAACFAVSALLPHAAGHHDRGGDAATRASRCAAGISDERTRVQAAVLTTVLGAIGIVVFSPVVRVRAALHRAAAHGVPRGRVPADRRRLACRAPRSRT